MKSAYSRSRTSFMAVPSAEELERYRDTCRRRDQQARQDQKRMHRDGRAAAQRAATLLRTEFDVDRVVLFGSVAQGAYLGPRSDVAVAVEGLFEEIAREVDRSVPIAASVTSFETCTRSSLTRNR
jgi:predicted nucleotidyltransferase